MVVTGEDALTAGDITLAAKASAAATTLARKGAEPAAQMRAKALASRVDRARAEWTSFEAAQSKLLATPDDPAANLSVGKWLSFWQGNWADGVGYLSKGSDPALAKAAKVDVAAGSGAPADTVVA